MTSCELVLVVDDVTQSLTKHSISRPIRIAQFLRKASDWSASADLAASRQREYTQLTTCLGNPPGYFVVLISRNLTRGQTLHLVSTSPGQQKTRYNELEGEMARVIGGQDWCHLTIFICSYQSSHQGTATSGPV